MTIFRNKAGINIRVFIYIIPLVFLIVIRLALGSVSAQGTVQLHSVMEFLAATISLFVGTLALIRFYARRQTPFLFIGAGFIGAGLLDAYHAMIAASFIGASLSITGDNVFPWSWNASPLFLSILILGSWIVRGRQNDTGRFAKALRHWTMPFLLLLFLLYAIFLLVGREYIASRPGQTASTIASLFLFWASVGYFVEGRWKHDRSEVWLIRGLLIIMAGQGLFMFFSQRLFDPFFTAAVALKQLGYISVSIGVLSSMYAILKQAERASEELRVTNEVLQREITERKRAEVKANQQRQLAEALREVGVALGAILEFDELLDALLDQIGQVIPYDQANVVMITLEDNVLQSARVPSHGFWGPDDLINASLQYMQEIADIRMPLVIPNTETNPRALEEGAREQIKSWAGAPVVLQNEVVALLTVSSSKPDMYKPSDAAVLTAFASQAAIAIKNARLYNEVQQNVEQLKELNDISQRAEAALAEERAHLAQHVKERTAELQVAVAELARASRLKDDFLASMSHELRTPLNTILGMVEALQEEVYGPLNEKQNNSLQYIEESGTHLLSLINDILDVSKIEGGKLELEPLPVSTRSVCEASVRFVKRDAHKKELDVQLDLEHAPETIVVDERRFKQILVNLLSNAVKFTPKGGRVGLRARVDAATKTVRFDVWDTGIGVATEEVERLFQPFVQVDSKLSREYNGTGLGLALVQRLVRLHGGTVIVDSEIGNGSCFTINLPEEVMTTSFDAYESQEMGKTAAATESNMAQTRVRVLLAEDNEVAITSVTDYLTVLSYEVIVARNGQEAVTMAFEHHPDLILMDMAMPKMDGMEAIGVIRSDPAFKQLPIIAVTALAMAGDKERCLAAGATDYLSKPLSLKLLIETIARYTKPRGQVDHPVTIET
ncbi:MAG: ATP-binding protein [Candidatus Promineifilaceae bacterium]